MLCAVIDGKPRGQFVSDWLWLCQVQVASGCRCLDINTTMMKANPLTDWLKQCVTQWVRKLDFVKGWAVPVLTERLGYCSYLCSTAACKQNFRLTVNAPIWELVVRQRVIPWDKFKENRCHSSLYCESGVSGLHTLPIEQLNMWTEDWVSS